MSDNVIDLLNDDEEVELKPVVIYSPKFASSLMLGWTSEAFGKTFHATIDLSRYLSSIWQTHPDGFRYINVKGIKLSQRISDETILKGELTLDMVYRDGEFTVNKAVFENNSFEPADPMVYTSFDHIKEMVVESITVDKQHVVVTGNKPAEQWNAPTPTPSVLSRITMRYLTEKNHPRDIIFDVPPHRGMLRRVSDGRLHLDMENVRLENNLYDEAGLKLTNQHLDVGVTLSVSYVNNEPVLGEALVVNPKLTVDGQEIRRGWFGYITKLHFDNGRSVNVDMPENYELHPFVYLEGMNHHPEHMGHWVPFNGWRMKDRYDLRLHNGEEHKYYYPNACAWSKFGEHDGPSRVEDKDVAFIRQVPDEECHEQYFFSGQERIKRNLSMFGDAVPDVYVLPDGSVQFKVRHRRMFRDEQIVADVSPADIFRHTSTILGHGDFTLTEVLHVPFRVDEPLFKAAIRYLKGQLENKLYSGFTLVEDARHGYIGTLNGQSFADNEVDWVIRQLIPIAQALPEKPEEKGPALVDPFRTGRGISINEKPNRNGRVYQFPGQPKKPKNNKALKKAAKKERVRALKEAKGGQA